MSDRGMSDRGAARSTDRPDWLVRTRESYVRQLAQLSPFYLKMFLREDIIRLTPGEARILFETACFRGGSANATGGGTLSGGETRRRWRRVRWMLWEKALDGLDTADREDWADTIGRWLEMETDVQLLGDIGKHPRWASPQGWAALPPPLKERLQRRWEACEPEQYPWAFQWWEGVREMNQMKRVVACAEGLYQHFRQGRRHLPAEDQTWQTIVDTLKTRFPDDLPLIRQIWSDKLAGLPGQAPDAPLWDAFQQVGAGEMESRLLDRLRETGCGDRGMSREELVAASRWIPENEAIREEVRTLWQTKLESVGKERRGVAAAALLNLRPVTPSICRRIMEMMEQGAYPFLSRLSGWGTARGEGNGPVWIPEFGERWQTLLKRASSSGPLRLEQEFIWAAFLSHVPETGSGNAQLMSLLATAQIGEIGGESLNVIAASLLRRELPPGTERDRLYQTGLMHLAASGPQERSGPQEKAGWLRFLLALLPETAGEAGTAPLLSAMGVLAQTPEGLTLLRAITSEVMEAETARNGNSRNGNSRNGNSGGKPSQRQCLLQEFWEAQLSGATGDTLRQALDCLREMADDIPGFVPGDHVFDHLKQLSSPGLSPGLQIRVHCLEMKLMEMKLMEMKLMEMKLMASARNWRPDGCPADSPWPAEFAHRLLDMEISGTGENPVLLRCLRQGIALSGLEAEMEAYLSGAADLTTLLRYLRLQWHMYPDARRPEAAGAESGCKRPDVPTDFSLWTKLWEELKPVYERENAISVPTPGPGFPPLIWNGQLPQWEIPQKTERNQDGTEPPGARPGARPEPRPVSRSLSEPVSGNDADAMSGRADRRERPPSGFQTCRFI